MKQVPFPGIAEPIGVEVKIGADGRTTTVTLQGRLSNIVAAILQTQLICPELFRQFEEEKSNAQT